MAKKAKKAKSKTKKAKKRVKAAPARKKKRVAAKKSAAKKSAKKTKPKAKAAPKAAAPKAFCSEACRSEETARAEAGSGSGTRAERAVLRLHAILAVVERRWFGGRKFLIGKTHGGRWEGHAPVCSRPQEPGLARVLRCPG